jgi:hypothetical protein
LRISCPNCKEAFPFVEESPEDFDEHGNRKPKPPQLLFFGKVITVSGVTILAFALYALETKKRVRSPGAPRFNASYGKRISVDGRRHNPDWPGVALHPLWLLE